jgi:hypothetical protein
MRTSKSYIGFRHKHNFVSFIFLSSKLIVYIDMGINQINDPLKKAKEYAKFSDKIPLNHICNVFLLERTLLSQMYTLGNARDKFSVYIWNTICLYKRIRLLLNSLWKEFSITTTYQSLKNILLWRIL